MDESAALEPRRGEKEFLGGHPILAVALTFLCPGLGHLYLRKFRQAAIYFFGLNLLFFLGLKLSGPLIFSLSGSAEAAAQGSKLGLLFLLPIPEIFHFSGTLAAAFIFLEQAVSAIPGIIPFGEVGATITAIAGILNLVVMTDAWAQATQRSPHAVPKTSLAVFLSWIMPGAGHFYLGEKFRGIYFFFFTNLLFLVGLGISHGLVVDRIKYFYYWAGQLLLGGPTVLSTLLTRHLRIQESLPWLDLGLLFVTIAGLLNVLVMISAYEIARAQEKSR